MAHESALVPHSVYKSARCRARYHESRTTGKRRAGVSLVDHVFSFKVPRYNFHQVAPSPHHHLYPALLVVILKDFRDIIFGTRSISTDQQIQTGGVEKDALRAVTIGKPGNLSGVSSQFLTVSSIHVVS